MIIKVHYPNDGKYIIRAIKGDSDRHYKTIRTEVQDGFVVDTYQIDQLVKSIDFETQYINKSYCKYSLFKKGWFAYAVSSIISFDYYIPENIITVRLSHREQAVIDIFFNYDAIKTKRNGCIWFINITKIDAKKAQIQKQSRLPLKKECKQRLKAAYICAELLNVFLYAFFPTCYLIILLYYPYLFVRHSFVDYVCVVFFYALAFFNLIRSYLLYKDVSDEVNNIL